MLNSLIGEYVKSAQPVSSQLLEKKCDFGVCPATIRIEMQKLTDAGLIFQPHTSSGRVPTDKGYRFFVDNLSEENSSEEDFDFIMEDWMTQEAEETKDTIKFIQSLTKKLSDISSNLVLGYLFEEKILWKEGWENILQEPEFKESNVVSSFARIVKSFDKEMEGLQIDSKVEVFIGGENPFSKDKEFSTIIERCCFPNKEEGIVAILGPKRMSYDRNIGLLNSLRKIMEDF